MLLRISACELLRFVSRDFVPVDAMDLQRFRRTAQGQGEGSAKCHQLARHDRRQVRSRLTPNSTCQTSLHSERISLGRLGGEKLAPAARGDWVLHHLAGSWRHELDAS